MVEELSELLSQGCRRLLFEGRHRLLTHEMSVHERVEGRWIATPFYGHPVTRESVGMECTEDDLELLVSHGLPNSDKDVSTSSAVLLGVTGNQRYSHPIIELLREEREYKYKLLLVSALGKLGGRDVMNALVDHGLTDSRPRVRSKSAVALSDICVVDTGSARECISAEVPRKLRAARIPTTECNIDAIIENMWENANIQRVGEKERFEAILDGARWPEKERK